MPDSDTPFDLLLARARGGDGAALAELARTYEPEVRIVARVLLGPALRPYLDSLDLVQSVHKSLMIGLRAQKFQLTGPDRLVALAVAMVRRKVGKLWRRHQRQRRLEGLPPASDTLPDALHALSTPDGDPGRAAQVRDAVEHVCAHLDPGERQIIELRLQGWTTAEVARKLG